MTKHSLAVSSDSDSSDSRAPRKKKIKLPLSYLENINDKTSTSRSFALAQTTLTLNDFWCKWDSTKLYREKLSASDDAYVWNDSNGKHFRRIIKRTKNNCRSELRTRDWIRLNFRSENPTVSLTTSPLHYPLLAHPSFWPFVPDKTPRIDYTATSISHFVHSYESKSLPVVITNATKNWPASKSWTPKNLLKYRFERFKVGEDDDGDAVYISLGNYLRYALPNPNQSTHSNLPTILSPDDYKSVIADSRYDDSPLYIFDSKFGDRLYPVVEGKPCSSEMLKDYYVPKFFRDDLFRLVGERKRPPFRWIVIGPARSGTGIHVDPLGTSAWNALISGHKRWVLFPPSTPKEMIDPRGLTDNEASTWFVEVYPSLVSPKTRDESGKSLAERYGIVEILQGPGEVVFVPGGWFHVVMNLDFTVAVTQNYCSRTNFEYVYLKSRFSRPKFTSLFLSKLSCLASSTLLHPFISLLSDRQKLDPGFSEVLSGEDEEWDVKNQKPNFFRGLVESVEMMRMVPELETSDSSSSSSSSDSDSSSDDD
ncbi:hypothetical protein HK098_000431 [Nowakowskiella sp. JEL0407]|nr:hypothetical protein HK098_000431 [Nowakowskiella sp. JEL0407]